MTITNTITLDLSRPSLPPVVYAKQGDADSRRIEATLTQNGTAYTIPTGATAIVRIGKPDGTGCYYDADSISGSIVTITLAEQALAAAGEARVEVNLYTADGERLTTLAFRLLVEKSVLADTVIESSDYFSALTATAAQILQAGVGVKIIDYYATLAALNSAIADPSPGDIYGVGSEGAYNYYGWSGAINDWVELGTIEGTPGDDGVSPAAIVEQTETGAIVTITDTNGTTTTELTNGTDGTGNNWFTGTAITGTSATPAAFATGITTAQANDLYLNKTTANVYQCAIGGNAATATWAYLCNIKGRDGDGAGDMLKAIYDLDDNGVVDDTEKLGGQLPAYYAKASDVPNVPEWALAENKPAYTATEIGALAAATKGSASGVAELDSSGRVPTSQLPSYVDDVVEYAVTGDFPAVGETGKIYVATNSNLTYRWSGTAYVEISPSLALGETSGSAYRGDRGKTAYEHSQATGNPHGTTAASLGAQAAVNTATALPASGTALAANTVYVVEGAINSAYEFVAPLNGGWAHGVFIAYTQNITFGSSNGSVQFLGAIPEFTVGSTYEFDVLLNTWVFMERVAEEVTP